MAEDANAQIRIDVDTTAALASIKNLQRQISVFHSTMAKSGSIAAASSAQMQQNLVNTINQTGKFNASIRNVKTTTESFTGALEKNKLSMGEYFRYAGASTKTFGRLFRTEFDTINKVARERVKTLQTQYIKLGRDANGAVKAIAVRPLALDMENLSTKTQIAAQRQALLNQLLKQGSTNLLNFGKNTQWAGRQLMVGFTIPLVMFGTVAAKTFMDVEKQAIRFKRVYGELFTTSQQTDKALQDIRSLANEFTKYGVAVSKTMELAADIAATGKMGADLTAQVAEATRLAILGGVEQAEALKATISLTDAFGTSAEDLAKKIDFLNAVENQTVTSIEDLTIAIPKAGPVVQQLGGDVQDLTFFLTAMREGGINASEGANALKSGLASLINPTEKASQFLQGFGVNLKGIVDANKGNVKGIVVDFAKALDTLDPLNRAQAIEQLFGKFQFARLSTLFQNVIKEGNQASRVLKLTNATTEELAILSERELKRVEDSPMFKFQKAVEDIKITLVPLGEAFLKAVTPVLEFGTKILEKFNELDSGAKNFVVGLTAVAGVIGPVFLMGFGLIANGVANIIKMFTFFKTALNGAASSSSQLGMQTEYMTQQQLEASSVAASLNQVHQKLSQTFTSEAAAVNALTSAYQRSVAAQAAMSGGVISRTRVPKKYASGVVSVPGPKGAGDIVPAMLSPGEAVIPAKLAKEYAPLISGMVSGNIPGFKFGLDPFKSMLGRSRVAVRMKSDDFRQALKSGGKDAKYQSAFATGTGADYRNRSGSENAKQKLARSAMERDLFGLDPKTTQTGARPTYGYAKTSPLQAIINSLFGIRGKQFNQVTGKSGSSLDIYGDLDLITKSSVAKRSSASVGDSLMNYVRTREAFSRRAIDYNTPMPSWMAEKFSQTPMRGNGARDFSLFEGRFGTPFGSNRQPGTNTYSVNSKPPYVETMTPGGFAFKEIDKVISNNPAIVKQLRAELKAAGLGGVRVSGPGFAARLFKKMGVPGYNKGTVSIDEFDPKVLKFAGKSYERQTPSKAAALKRTIEMLQSNGIADNRIISRMEELYGRPDRNALNPTKLTKNLGYTVGGQKTERGAGKSSSSKSLAKLANSRFFEEQKAIIRFIRDNNIRNNDGSPLTKSQIRNLIQVQASHFERVPGQAKDWTNLSKLAPDLGALNNYMSSTIEKNLGKELLALDDKTLKSYGIDRKELQNLANGNHPLTAKAAETYKAIARYDLANPSSRKRYTAQIAIKAIEDRLRAGFYNNTLPTFQQLINDGSIAGKSSRSQIIDGSSGARKPPKAQVVGGSVSDNRNVDGTAAKKGETFLNTDSTQAIKSGRTATVPGIGRIGKFGPMRMPGADDGFPRGQFSDGTERVYQTESGQFRDRATKKRLAEKEAKRLMRLDRQNEQRREKAEKVRALKERRAAGLQRDYGMSQKDYDKLSKESQAQLRNERNLKLRLEKQDRAEAAKARIADEKRIAEEKRKIAQKEEKKAARAQKLQGMGGKIAGGVGAVATIGVMGASMMGGQIGEIAQQMMMPVMMLSMMLPMLANPIGIAVLALGGLAAAAFMLDKQFKDNIKKAYELETAMGSGTAAIDPLAKAAGKVTASEILDRRREGALNPFEVKPGKTTFGQSYMQSEAGQGLKSTISTAFLELGRDTSVSKLVNQMATAVMSGAVSPAQARSVVASLAQELGDTSLGVAVNARLTELLGPNGENILTNGLEIRTKLIEDSRAPINISSKPTIGQELQSSAFRQALNPSLAAYGGLINNGEALNKRSLSGGDIGTMVANTTNALQVQKQMVDSLQLEYEEKVKNAKISINTAKTEKDRKKAVEDLAGIEAKYIQDRNALASQNKITIDQLKEQIGLVSNQTDVINAYRNTALEIYKDDPFAMGILGTKGSGGLLDRIDTEGDDALTAEQSIVLNAELVAKNIDVTTLGNILSGENSETVVDIITKLGGTEADRIFDLANLITDETKKADFLIEVNKGNVSSEDLAAMESLYKLTANSTAGEIILNAYIDDEGLNDQWNKQKAALEAEAEKGPITLKTVQELEQKGVLEGTTVSDTIKQNQEYFDSLPEEDRMKYVQSIVVAANLEGDEAIMGLFRAWQLEQGGKETSFGAVVGGGTFQQFLHEKLGFPITETGGDDTVGDTGTKPGPTGGTKKESPFSNILKDLKELRQDAVNATGGIKELLKWLGKGKNMTPFKGTMNALVAGGTTEEFQGFVSGLDKKAQKDLFKIIDGVAILSNKGKAVQKAFSEISIGQFVIEQQRSVANSKNQEIAANRLIAAGMSTSEAYEAVKDSAFAAAIATMKLGKNGREELKTIVNAANEAKNAIKGMSPDELGSLLKEKVNAAVEKVQIDFEFAISGDMSIIRSAEAEIAALQFALDDYQAELQEIVWKESQVNDKYDKRVDALEKVRDVNADIAEQQKSQLSVAEAITRGDLSATARAVQDLRESQAARAFERQSTALSAAREKELQGLRSSKGKSRLQLEDLVLEKEKEIFKIEEDRLEPARERVRLLEVETDKALESLKLQSLSYDRMINNIKNAELSTQAYNDKLKEALATLQKMAGIKLPGADSEAANTRPGPEKDGTFVGQLGPQGNFVWDGKSWVKVSSQTGSSILSPNPNFKPTPGNMVPGPEKPGTTIGQLGPQGNFIWNGQQWVKRASGGYISGPGTATSDSIPALLSNGEYVIKASSVNKFGKNFLDRINSGSMPEYGKGGKILGYKNGGGVLSSGFSGIRSLSSSGLKLSPKSFYQDDFKLKSNNTVILSSSPQTQAVNSSSVYNYNLSVNVSSISDPNAIAQTVMGQIRRVDSQRLRGNRF